MIIVDKECIITNSNENIINTHSWKAIAFQQGIIFNDFVCINCNIILFQNSPSKNEYDLDNPYNITCQEIQLKNIID